MTALQTNEIDFGIGLTEGWIAALGKAQAQHSTHHDRHSHDHGASTAGFKLVGTYVETPLCWAISTGANRSDLQKVEDLKGKRVGVSRIGSGSYVMSYVLAEQQGWLSQSQSQSQSSQPESGRVHGPFGIEVLNTFKNLRDGVNKTSTSSDGSADFFMWEHFTSNRYYSTNEIKRVGEIYTPWPSWHIVASTSLLTPQNHSHPQHANSSNPPKPAWNDDLEDVLQKINRGVEWFEGHKEEAVEYISTHLDYSEEDARAWLETVKFAGDVRGVDLSMVGKTVGILKTAGVLGEGVDEGGMIAQERSTS